MNFIKQYTSTITDIWNEFTLNSDSETKSETLSETEQNDTKLDISTSDVTAEVLVTEELEEDRGEAGSTLTKALSQGGQYFSWIPSVLQSGESVLTRYINTLANFGTDDNANEAVGSTVAEQCDVVTSAPTQLVAEVADPIPEKLSEEVESSPYFHWLNDIYTRSEQVWSRMKDDFNEVVTVASTEPKQVVERTASSVRHHLSVVATKAREIEPPAFLTTDYKGDTDDETKEENIDPDTKIGLPPDVFGTSHFVGLRSGVNQVIGVVGRHLATSTAFLGLGGSLDIWPSSADRLSNKREARLQVLRADPSTYETVPLSPPESFGLLSYTDWRSAYFDDELCQPRPGIPLPGIERSGDEQSDALNCLEPCHPGPSELLATNPIMREHLLRLVAPDNETRGMTDADFWSRYYYRVWLLDVTERRRQQVIERAVASSTVTTSGITQAQNVREVQLHKDWTEDDSDTEWQEAESEEENEVKKVTVEQEQPTLSDNAELKSSRAADNTHGVVELEVMQPEHSELIESVVSADTSAKKVTINSEVAEVETSACVVGADHYRGPNTNEDVSADVNHDGSTSCEGEKEEEEEGEEDDDDEEEEGEEDDDDEEEKGVEDDDDEEEEGEEDDEDELVPNTPSITLQLPTSEECSGDAPDEEPIDVHSTSSGATGSNASSLVVVGADSEEPTESVPQPHAAHEQAKLERPSKPEPPAHSSNDWGDTEIDQTLNDMCNAADKHSSIDVCELEAEDEDDDWENWS